MAIETVITLVVTDDLDGTRLDDGQGLRHRFAVEGQDYEMDLSADNSESFREAMHEWIKIARKVGKPRKTETARPVGTETDIAPGPAPREPHTERQQHPQPKRRKGVKDWANQHGFDLNPNGGRVPREVEEAYDAYFGAAS